VLRTSVGQGRADDEVWIPAFAGMTEKNRFLDCAQDDSWWWALFGGGQVILQGGHNHMDADGCDEQAHYL